MRNPEIRIDSIAAAPAVASRPSRWTVGACAIAAVAAWFLLAAPARASGGAQNPSKGLVSPRYQAKSCDTASSAGRRYALGGQLAASRAEPAPQAAIRPSTAPGSPSSLLQYQFRNAIPQRVDSHSRAFQTTAAANSTGSCPAIASEIASTTFETSIPEDGRRLLQLAVAFAFAYVIFLTAWFWSTRERRGRVGRAARS
jgi:hypothetical protein